MVVVMLMVMVVMMLVIVVMMLMVMVVVMVVVVMMLVSLHLLSLFLSVYKNMYVCAMNAALFRLLFPHFHTGNSDFIKSFHKSFRIIMQL
jgi:hypothetical protein